MGWGGEGEEETRQGGRVGGRWGILSTTRKQVSGGLGNCCRLGEGIRKWPVPVWDFGKYILFFQALTFNYLNG